MENKDIFSFIKTILDNQSGVNPRIFFNLIRRTEKNKYIRLFTVDHYNSVDKSYNRDTVENITNAVAKITKNRLSKDKSCIMCPWGWDGYNVVMELSLALYNNKDKIIGKEI